MLRKNLFTQIVILFSFFNFSQKIFAQCTTTTVNIDFDGAFANGCTQCISMGGCCGDDYRCYTNGIGSA